MTDQYGQAFTPSSMPSQGLAHKLITIDNNPAAEGRRQAHMQRPRHAIMLSAPQNQNKTSFLVGMNVGVESIT